MLVNLEPYGRLGNRLFLGAHLLAFSRKFDVPLLNLGFGEYASLFPYLERNAAFAFPWEETGDIVEAARIRRTHLFRERLPWSKRFHYWGDRDWEFDQDQGFPFAPETLRTKNVYFRAWLFRGYVALQAHRELVLQVFRPHDSIVSATKDWIHELRQNAEVLVGVHVRWEDYRGTEWFLDQGAFGVRMESAAQLFPGKVVKFVVFSNEKLPQHGWGSLDLAFSSGTTPQFDLAAMSLCDALLAPPSTFSGWASFYGQVPLATLSAGESTVRRETFRTVKG